MVFKAVPRVLPGREVPRDIAPALVVGRSIDDAAGSVAYPAGVTFEVYAVGKGSEIGAYDINAGPDPELCNTGIFRKLDGGPGRTVTARIL